MKRAFLLAAVVCVAGLFSVCASGDSAVTYGIAKNSVNAPVRAASSVPVSAVRTVKSAAVPAKSEPTRAAVSSTTAAASSARNSVTALGAASAAVSSTSSSSSYLPPVYTVSTPSASNNAVGYFTNNAAPQTKNIVFQGSSETLHYANSFNRSSTALQNRSDTYGTCDYYTDDAGNRFEYLYNANQVIGFLAHFNLSGANQSTAVSMTQAQTAGLQFAKQYAGDLSDYQFDSYYYNSCEGLYHFTYVKWIASFKTDDQLIFWVTAQGNPVQFSTFYRGRYDKYKNISADIAANQTAMTAGLKKLGFTVVDFTVNKPYLTLSDSGKLQLVFKPLNGDNSYAMDLIYTQKS